MPVFTCITDHSTEVCSVEHWEVHLYATRGHILDISLAFNCQGTGLAVLACVSNTWPVLEPVLKLLCLPAVNCIAEYRAVASLREAQRGRTVHRGRSRRRGHSAELLRRSSKQVSMCKGVQSQESCSGELQAGQPLAQGRQTYQHCGLCCPCCYEDISNGGCSAPAVPAQGMCSFT